MMSKIQAYKTILHLIDNVDMKRKTYEGYVGALNVLAGDLSAEAAIEKDDKKKPELSAVENH